MLKNFIDETTTILEYTREFTREDTSGFSFPCDKDGNVELGKMAQCAIENYNWCMAHPEEFDEFNVRNVWTHKIRSRRGTCSCGRVVELYNQYYGACSCECGRWYNLFGQELVAPQYWEIDPSEEDPYDYGCDEDLWY